MGASPERLTRVYRRSYAASDAPTRAALGALDDVARARFRDEGQRLVAALVAHLDADPSDEPSRARAEAEAEALVDELGRRLAAQGTSLTEAVAMFVAARRPFLTELAGLGRRRTLDGARLGRLYEDASALLDRLLLRLVAAHQGAHAAPGAG